ncbi:two-component sensor histidine kinase [Kineosporia sp. NBRC 101677]|uniref:sensor histidine kinase n=1 Tax=Kineosporia sp. NBRC 101677 TaxID=3032197 RepID=UPI0024A3D85F|nr:histidine kinase [Kineosporia sp. NBRC 101677]GLY15119.1 two-component sensor histidine kinase [Kineosporia sp. NBRC 101677]
MQKLGPALLLAAFSLGGLAEVVVEGTGAGFLVPSFAVCAVAGLLIWRQPHEREVLLGGAASICLASALLTLAAVAHLVPARFSPTEVLGLLTLVLLVSRRRCTGTQESVVLLALVLTAVAAPWREPSATSALAMSVVALAASVSVVAGWSLREGGLAVDRRVAGVLAEQRQGLARDLHDDLAHHVTGIIVAAQAAAVVTGPESAAARAALQRIEQAAVDALESMRSTVALLRVDDQEAVARLSGPEWPWDLISLVKRFGQTTGIRTTLTIRADQVPTEHCQTVHRVTQEALTNVSRHARLVSRADVVIDRDERGLLVLVTDDGAGSREPFSSGGFGLLGIRERARALGGEVRAGRRENGGWQVEVVLPMTENPVREIEFSR